MSAAGKASWIDSHSFAGLIPALKAAGYTVIGPTVRDGAIVYEPLERFEDLPAGWTDIQAPGQYRLRKSGSPALFAYHPGPHSWKKFLHPAGVRLFSPESTPRFAFIGVRACEVAAIRIQDRILVEDRYADVIYESRRRDLFIVAVNCTDASDSCFCESLGAGPHLQNGYDLAVTEVAGNDRHEFFVEPGSPAGQAILDGLKKMKNGRTARPPAPALRRKIDTAGLRELLTDNFDHPRWDETARRCLACGNCTMVCPTCFCTTVEDSSTITGETSRLRKWDSCFTQSFSYIHGGSVRSSVKARYRQWLTHKFSTWIDQFGTPGCVGCGRCITWCPAGIDIIEELKAIRESSLNRPVAAAGSQIEELYGIAGADPQ